MGCAAIFAIPVAGGGFFLSSWMLMMFWGVLAPRLSVPTLSYGDAMTVTIALWLVLAPLIVALRGARRSNRQG